MPETQTSDHHEWYCTCQRLVPYDRNDERNAAAQHSFLNRPCLLSVSTWKPKDAVILLVVTQEEAGGLFRLRRNQSTTRRYQPTFFSDVQQELLSQHRAPSITETRDLELEREWDTQEPHTEVPTGTQNLVRTPPGNRTHSP